MDSGATMKDAAVRVPLTMAPGAAAALVVGTAHAVTSVLPGVHVKETMPVNPPSPVMVTGKVPIAPLATLALPAVTEKSQAVPVSANGLGAAIGVVGEHDGAVVRTWRAGGAGIECDAQHAGRPAWRLAMVIGTAPQEFEAIGVVGAGGDRSDRQRISGARVADCEGLSGARGGEELAGEHEAGGAEGDFSDGRAARSSERDLKTGACDAAEGVSDFQRGGIRLEPQLA